MTLGLTYTLVSLFAIFFVGAIVYFHNRKSITHLLFLLMAISTVLWGIANYYSTISPEEILNIRLVIFFAVPHIVLFLLFILNFPKDHFVVSKQIAVLLFGAMLALMGLAISPYVFSDISLGNGLPTPEPGSAMPIFAGGILLALFASLFIMARKYARAEQKDKRRWFFMLFGTLLSYAFLILTNFVFVVFYENTNFIVFGPLFMLPTFAGMALAILRYQLFDIKAVSAELLTFVVLFISMTEVLLARTLNDVFIRLAIFLAFLIFGILLVRAVINEVKQRERIQELAGELSKANERLRELDRQKSEFLSIAAHQLRTPLTSIKGYSSLMLEGSYGKLPEKVKPILETIFTSSARMVDTVSDFLNVSRIEQNKMEYRKIQTDLGELAQNAVRELALAAKEKGLDLELHHDKETKLPIFVDISKVQHVLTNLLDNAVKYTPKGRITVRVEKNQDTGVVRVHDTGAGIPKGDLPTLFDKFIRARNAQDVNVTGTGLGLYVAREMIKAHGGRIWAESEGERKGSTFIVEIPLHTAAQEPEKSPQE